MISCLRKNDLKVEISYNRLLCLLGIGLLSLLLYIVYLINPYVLERIFSSSKALFISIIYTFCILFGIDVDIKPEIIEYPISKDNIFNPPIEIIPPLPSLPNNIDIFNIRMNLYNKSLLNSFTYEYYYMMILNILKFLLMVVMLLVLVLLLHKVINYNKKPKIRKEVKLSKTYNLFDRLSNWFFYYKQFIKGLFLTLFHNKYFKNIVMGIIFFTTVYSVLIDFLAYYIYIISYFVAKEIYFGTDIYNYGKRLLFDLNYLWRFLLLYLPFFLYKFREKLISKGINRLLKFDMINKILVRLMPYIVFIDGKPGVGKTDSMQDMGAYAEEIQREDALKDLLELQSMFPKFPWRIFEMTLDDFRKKKIISNWRNIEDVIDGISKNNHILGYDLTNEVYADGLVYNKLKDVLSDYACLYFLYSTNNPICFSNFAIRSDNRLESECNFPYMNFNAYTKTEDDVEYSSKYTCNLIRDMVRTGKRIDINDIMNGAFEFGVIVETEADKEYGNKNTNAGQKKESNMPNSRNDGANIFKMLIRHWGTKRFKSYVKWFFDAQRKDSVNAGLTQISTILHLTDKSKYKNTFPFFSLIEFIHDFLWNRYVNYLMIRKVYRADYKLSFYLIDTFMSKIHRCFTRISNIYGYQCVTFNFEDGNGNVETEKHVYRLMTKRAHANKYATDALRDMLRSTTENPNIGYDDFERFRSVYADVDEYKRQGSRMVKDILEPGWDDEDNDIDIDNNFIENGKFEVQCGEQ